MSYLERVEKIIAQYNLTPHPEGGFYKETFRSEGKITESGKNNLTSIYFLLVDNHVSHFHRIQSDECWYFHEGTPLEIHELHPDGTHVVKTLGLGNGSQQEPFAVVHGNTIFGSHLKDFLGYALVSCAVAPGFDFSEFELFSRKELVENYPKHQKIIDVLTTNE